MQPRIPDKRYFKIGEVAELVAVETHVLRFWETEFPQIKPNRDLSSQRLYRRRDVELFMEIKRLLYDDQFTIAGARKKMEQAEKSLPLFDAITDRSLLREIRESLLEIKDILEK